MIVLSTLTRQLQDGLNAITDKEFAIFTDVGEFKNAYRGENSNKITHYINGIMEAMSPTRLPMKNLEVVTQSFRVGFVLDVALLNKDENGEFIEVKEVRAILENYIKGNNGIPYYLTDSDNKQFEITPTFSGITVGRVEQLSPLGETLPMYLDFSCVFIQGGTNTNTVEFIINGKNMFYQSYSMIRTRTAETNMVANEKSSKTLVQANGISLNLVMPLIDEDESLEIEDDVYNGTQNQAICVERYRASAKNPYNCYIMIYGNNSETGAIGQNVGQTVDFVEGKADELNYSDLWNTTKVVIDNNLIYNLTLVPTSKTIVVFWGDGESSKVNSNYGEIETISHNYKKQGNYTIRQYCYDKLINFYYSINGEEKQPIEPQIVNGKYRFEIYLKENETLALNLNNYNFYNFINEVKNPNKDYIFEYDIENNTVEIIQQPIQLVYNSRIQVYTATNDLTQGSITLSTSSIIQNLGGGGFDAGGADNIGGDYEIIGNKIISKINGDYAEAVPNENYSFNYFDLTSTRQDAPFINENNQEIINVYFVYNAYFKGA